MRPLNDSLCPNHLLTTHPFARPRSTSMKPLLKLSAHIDKLNERVGSLATWAVLAAVLVSALNAIVRKIFNTSSNAFLELQWYLFSAIFLLCAGYTLLRNEHVRIDIITSRLSPRAQNWIDIIGILIFLLPMAVLVVWLSWPSFMNAFNSGEHSNNAGGLLVWPVRLLVPVGFALLMLQGFSELIKRIAFLRGLIANPLEKTQARSAEEELALAIKSQRSSTGDAA